MVAPDACDDLSPRELFVEVDDIPGMVSNPVLSYAASFIASQVVDAPCNATVLRMKVSLFECLTELYRSIERLSLRKFYTWVA